MLSIIPSAAPINNRKNIPAALTAAVASAFAGGYLASYVLWHINPTAASYAGTIGFHVGSLIKSFMDIAGLGNDNYAIQYFHATQETGWISIWRVGLTYATSLLIGIYLFKYLSNGINPIKHIRGRQLVTGKAAIVEAIQNSQAENIDIKPGIEIIVGSNIHMSQDRETKHIIVVGGTGSGKTVSLSHILVQAVARNDRVLLIDYKGLTERCPGDVLIADPTDKRGIIWDIAADILTPWEAEECAARMIPYGGSSPFWTDGSRAILAGLIVSLINKKPKKWGFQDLLF